MSEDSATVRGYTTAQGCDCPCAGCESGYHCDRADRQCFDLEDRLSARRATPAA